MEINLQDMSAQSYASKKSPVTIINEYASKNQLVPHYNLIQDGSSLSIPSFKYTLTLDKFVAIGEGSSKRLAKHLAASDLLKKIIEDKPQLLNTDFNECAISTYDNNNKVNSCFGEMNKVMEIDLQDMSAQSYASKKTPVTIINEYASKNQLVPHYNLIQDGSSLSIPSFKYTLTLYKFLAVGEGSSKKLAKHLAASNLLKKMIDYKRQLLNTDYNEFAVSTYDNNNKVNAFFREMNKVMELDIIDLSAQSCASNKTPVTIINEYAIKHHLVPHYKLIHDGSLLSTTSFKYNLTLDKFVVAGEGSSKTEAKHSVTSNLLKKIFDDEPQLLNTDFDKCTVSPYGNNIKVNSIGQLNNMCRNNNIELPEYNLVKEKKYHVKLFTISCQVGEMIKTATHRSKKQAKYLAAAQMINSLMSSDIVIENFQNVSDSPKAVEKIFTFISWPIKKSAPNHLTCTNYHLVLKKIEWKNSDTLNMVVNQYLKNGELDLPEPYKILKKIVTEHKMHLNSRIQKIKLNFNNYHYLCTFAITDIYPPIYGLGVDTNFEMARHIAVKELLIGICILLK